MPQPPNLETRDLTSRVLSVRAATANDEARTVEAVVTAADDRQKLLRVDGFLSVDGRVIYAMKNFTVQARAA